MMTDAELIAYLRLQGLDKDIAAADRIEALKAHYEVLWETNLRIGIERDTFKASIEALNAECDDSRKEWEGWQSAAVKLMDKLTAMTAERDQWIAHAKNAVWTDSEELKLAETDNARLRAALELDPWFVGREAWKKYASIALTGDTT